MKKLSQREKILDNYIYFKTILPQSFSKIHIPKKKNIVSSKFILPNYIFNYNDNMSTNKKKDIFSKTIILTDGNINMKVSKTKKQKRNLSLINSRNKTLDNVSVYSKNNKDDGKTQIIEKSRYFSPNEIKLLNLYGISKDFKSVPVQNFEYKKNLFLPSITQRMKMSKPRYDREYNNNYYHTKIVVNI